MRTAHEFRYNLLKCYIITEPKAKKVLKPRKALVRLMATLIFGKCKVGFTRFFISSYSIYLLSSSGDNMHIRMISDKDQTFASAQIDNVLSTRVLLQHILLFSILLKPKKAEKVFAIAITPLPLPHLPSMIIISSYCKLQQVIA